MDKNDKTTKIPMTKEEVTKARQKWAYAKRRGFNVPIKLFIPNPPEHKKRERETNSKAAQIGLSQKEYRKVYARWKAAKKRGHDVSLQLFLDNKIVRFNKGKTRKYYHQKNALKRALATPKWVNIEDIASFYGYCPKNFEVDHIVPINGENVCGLHVPWNLQYLTKEEHKTKTKKNVKKEKIFLKFTFQTNVSSELPTISVSRGLPL